MRKTKFNVQKENLITKQDLLQRTSVLIAPKILTAQWDHQLSFLVEIKPISTVPQGLPIKELMNDTKLFPILTQAMKNASRAFKSQDLLLITK